MENMQTRIRDMDFNKYKKYQKKCLHYNKDGNAYLKKKNLFSINDITGDEKYSNLYLEVMKSSYTDCAACWLWKDFGCIVVKVCYIYPCYTIDSNLREEALKNQLVSLKK